MELARADESIDYNRDVRPLLANHCFKCHGPDEQSRQAGLRLDDRQAATAVAESGDTAIVPGKPDQSELVARIFSHDPDVQMPPQSANKPLNDAQRDVLRRWVAAGAEYQPHWAFVPPKQAELPSVKNGAWAHNPIDRFILARIEAAGLAPAPEADKHTLARRLFLDLIGLPPTPEEVDTFVNDTAPDAYEKLVDRLLASPHYGERWARRWLDLARYADTNGYEKDRTRSIWPYRDWVINALNADMPFDQFTVEQVAGDMLPDATPEQRIATGFHRNTMLNEEGGVDPLEFRFYSVVDRVNTTGTVWLGLTVGCAQCHTHKYDPLPHRDYYRLMAFLNNADEPKIDVPRAEIAAERAKIEAELAAEEATLAERFPLDDEFQWHVPSIVSLSTRSGADIEALEDGVIRVSGKSPDKDVYEIVFDGPAAEISALQLEALPEPGEKRGPGRTKHGNFVVTEIVLSAAPAGAGNAEAIPFATASADFSQDGFTPDQAFDGNNQTGWAIAGANPPRAARTAEFRFAKPVAAVGSGLRYTLRLEQNHGTHHTLGRFRLHLGEPKGDNRPVEERRREHLDRKYNEWLALESSRAGRWTPLQPVTATSGVPILTVLADRSVLASGDQTKSDVYKLSLDNPLGKITGLRIEVLPDDSLPNHGPGRVSYEGAPGDFFLSEFTIRVGDKQIKVSKASHSFAAGSNSAAEAVDGNPETGWAIDGGQGDAHTAAFQLTEPIVGAERIEIEMLSERYFASGVGRFKIWATDDEGLIETYGVPTDIEALIVTPAAERTPADQERLRKHFLSIAPETAGLRSAIERRRKEMPAFPTTLAFSERPAEHPRATFLHKRGEFLQPVEELHAELPSLFAPLAADEPHDRLSFARWLASSRNPLVARVTVNRNWAALFGRGLVRTTEDFGYQGEPPTHPELLDWLSVEFMRNGWSVKSLHRLIVSSATYRQSAVATPAVVEGDPQNRLLARAPRVRLDAELVRDAALRATGLMSEKIGGPSVFPPQPAGVSTEGAYGPLNWHTSKGEDRYRRGLYTFSKRTAPYAMFNTFDAPSGEACLARREVSNTPLQSLTLLNDSVFVEGAQALGQAMASRDGTIEERITLLFRRCVSRPPRDDEQQLLVEFFQTQRDRAARGEIDAAKIANAGEGDAADRAAWTLTARAVLNLDETITKE